MNFVEFLRDYLIEKIEGFNSLKCYACDIGFGLLEDENNFGFDDEIIEQTLIEYSNDLKDVVKEVIFAYGKEYAIEINPFTDEKKAITILLLEAMNYLISRCNYIEEHWNEEITLDETTTQILISQLNSLDSTKKLYDL